MNVETSALHGLLDLQAEDTALKRLHERRQALPEAQRLAEITEQVEELTADLQHADKQHTEVARQQDKLEGEIAIVDEKIAREEKRLFGGQVSNPKELGALQAEVAMLKRKRAEFEDALLEVMVQKEDAGATLERLKGEQATASESAQALTKIVDDLMREIDLKLEMHGAKRDSLRGPLPAELLSLYDKIRETKGGVGAAALEGGTCQGCHTKLPNKEIEQMKAEGGLQRCENCRRILVIV